ncbi:MAG: DUF2298 domain-containing protein [Dehalococcoidia bacterium]|nr:DUF2298 domain-containing protein [Dehalococcoidia bacterium]
MLETLTWWVVVQLIGIVALPVTFLLFARLPDRGYAFCKPLGILLLSYALWLGGIAHVLPNSRGSIVVLLFVFFFGSLLLFSRRREELVAFIRDNKRTILIEEGLFLLAFLLWTFVRSYNPEIRTTEQPMDFGFMNAIYRSEFFPPNDPWLAGNAISYYYFGYLIMATLAKLSGIVTSVAYNLSLSMLFGLVAVGAFSIAFNLATFRDGVGTKAAGAATGGRPLPLGPDAEPVSRRGGVLLGRMPAPVSNPVSAGMAPIIVGLLGALFVVGVGNLEGLLEVLRAHHLGTAELWRWIGIKDALQPYTSVQWYPTENWWWWRATRVINTLAYTLDPQGVVTAVSDRADYTITEFPFFSFLLGDMHPHLMALPFGLLSIALSLNVIGQGEELLLALPMVASGTVKGRITMSLIRQGLGVWLRRHWPTLGMASIILGSLGFLNSWDFPTQTLLFLASASVGMFLVRRTIGLELVLTVAALCVVVGLGGVVLYLPFYVGFQSQASGVLPVLGPGTQFVHFAIIWGLFLTVLVTFLAVLTREAWARGRGNSGHGRAIDRAISSWPVVVVFASVAVWAFVAILARPPGPPADDTLSTFLSERAWRLVPMVAAAIATLSILNSWLKGGLRSESRQREARVEHDTGVVFALLLMAVGFALVLGCELFFIRDVFGTRMNTVFKLYYQAWILLALASAYGLYYVSRRLLYGGWKPVGLAFLALTAALTMGSLVYPVAAVFSKTNNFAGPPTLDGTAYVKGENTDEYQAIQWLNANAPDSAVILEATGGQYSEYARVATRTGLPNVLGWAGHEMQWRGSDKAYLGRPEDIDTLFRSADRTQVLTLLQKYNVTYVYAGNLERSKYGQVALDRFAVFMDTVFKNETTAIYRVRR